ncbi:MAG: FAD-dependent monooxygenase, partial [Thiotrichaceae bacterium]|nr:FAD-dependent monooxygenase [Thiotrichaceae bacterium]
MTKTKYDIAILGGGMAGISMALSLAQIKTDKVLHIAVFEKTAFDDKHQSSFDDRCIALSAGSQQIYQAMGIWNKLTAVEPIKKIHISEHGKMGFSRLDSHNEKVDALGYVVESYALGKVLIKHLKQLHKQQHKVDIFCPAQIKSINYSENKVNLSYTFKDKQQTLTASLLIAADGGQSFCHQFLTTPPSVKAYQQSAIIANIETQYPHQGEAFERFTKSGPLAILPLTETNGSKNRCSLVWTVEEKNVDKIMSLSDSDFIAQLQQKFGYRLGNIVRTGKRFCYPLILKNLDSSAVTQLKRLVFVGNSAHAIHPVSGQGFNLGLRDID